MIRTMLLTIQANALTSVETIAAMLQRLGIDEVEFAENRLVIAEVPVEKIPDICDDLGGFEAVRFEHGKVTDAAPRSRRKPPVEL